MSLVPLLLLLGVTLTGGTLDEPAAAITTVLPPPALLLACEGLDTCQQSGQRAPRLADMTDWKERNCLCDEACAQYDDCCDDAPFRITRDPKRRTFECVDMRNFGGIYMVTTCSATWRGERRSCEQPDSADPLGGLLPVTDPESRVTYRNVHCALCNEAPSWQVWGARLECPTVLTGSRDLASVRRALTFDNGTWGLMLPRQPAAPVPQPPHEPPEKSDKFERLQALLQATNETSRIRPTRGRNVTSRGDRNHRTTTERTTTLASAVLSTSSGLRHLSRRHYALYNASQFHRNDSALATLLRQRRLQTARARRDTENDAEQLVFHRCEVDPLLPDTLTHLVRRCRPDVIRECPGPWGDENVRNMCEQHTAHVFHSSGTYHNVYCAMCWGVQVQLLSCQPQQLYTRFAFNKDFNVVAFAVLFDFAGGQGSVGSTCPKGQLFDPFLGSCRRLVCDADDSDASCVALRAPLRSLGTHDNTTMSNSASGKNTSFAACESSRLLQEREFSVVEDRRVLVVAASGDQLDEDKYQLMEDGSALICNLAQLNFTLDGLDYTEQDKFGAILGYITLVGLCISIICLTLHLLAFCLVSDRSSHGGGSGSGNSNSSKNLASLCSALLVAYCGFLSGQLVRDDHEFCVSSAVVTYYSFLAAFTWMFAVSLDIWRSLRLATTQLRTSYSGRGQWRKFLINSLCCWLLPACVVLAAVIVENAPRGAVMEELRPGFGARPGICWFSNRRALLIFFAAPVSAVMLLNAIFFTSSALMIYSTTASTAGGPRRDFRLYLRLAVLMGLTWSVGLLAGFLDAPLLWVIFVVLNTLQGLFIFLAFTCTHKMLRPLKEVACCWRSWTPRRRRRRELAAVMPVRKLGVPSSSDHLPWSNISSSFASSKSSNSEESRATDDTLY